MDETQDLLKAIIGRLKEMGADLKGLRTEFEALGARLDSHGSEMTAFRLDTNERLEKIEEYLYWLATKWMEHDLMISKLKRRRA